VCRQEFLGLETDVWQPYQAKGVTVVGLDPGFSPAGAPDTQQTIQIWTAANHDTFPCGLGTRAGSGYDAFSGDAGQTPFPIDVIVDANKKIVYVNNMYDPAAIKAVLDGL
jgi:hypothetical protein